MSIKKFADTLFSRYPHWKQYVTESNPELQDALCISVPSRFAPECPLRIYAEEGAITVAWGNWDIHCDKWAGMSSVEERIDKALVVIDDIINERFIIIDSWKNGRLCGSFDSRVETLDADIAKSELYTSQIGGNSITSRSWAGTYDRGELDPTKLEPRMNEEELIQLLHELEADDLLDKG